MSDGRNKEVRQYMDEKVKPDGRESSIQREMATGVITQVRDAIPHAGNIQFSGSNYEGNATKHNSDFDAMVNVAPKGSQFQVENADRPGFGKLKYHSGGDERYAKQVVTGDGYVSSKAVVQQQVQPAIDRAIGIQNHGGHLNVNGTDVEIKRSVHGPAVTLDLKSGKHEAQVDIVSSIGRQHVVGGKEGVDYVAKPSTNSAAQDRDTMWRQSYSGDEKAAFKDSHKGNQSHSDVLKTAKTVRADNSTLSSMPSYVMKTATLNLMDKDEQRVSQGGNPKSWTAADSADRLQDLGKEVSKGLQTGVMTHPSNRAVNILEGTSQHQREQWSREIGSDGQGLVNKAKPS